MSYHKGPSEVNEAKNHSSSHSLDTFGVCVVQQIQFQQLGWDNCGVHGVIDVIGKEFVVVQWEHQFPVHMKQEPKDNANKLADGKGQGGKQVVSDLL